MRKLGLYYVHKIHLFILWYISPLWLKILKICKLHEIPYEMLHKRCLVNFIRLLLLSTELFRFEIQKYGKILCVHKPHFLMLGHNCP